MRPPRLAEGILARLLPERDRSPILGDLAEEYARLARTSGTRRARWWYRAQVTRALLPAIRHRLTRRTTAIQERTMGAGGMSFSWVDVKLGLRMLRKHGGLTLAAVLALAVGIPVGMAPTQLADVVSAPLPEDPVDRIRVIRYWNVETNQPQPPTDFELAEWQRELSSFEVLGAYRREPFGYSVSIGDGTPARASGAEVTASTFGILGRAPLLGRTLAAADQRAGAPAVVAIGYAMWQSRLAGDPDVIGRTLRVGGVPHTIVGVMPAGFLFPRHGEIWLPLHTEPAPDPASASTLLIVGKLARGVSTQEAQAQVSALGRRMVAEFPETHAQLRAEVVRYGTADWNLPKGGIRAWPGFLAIQLLCLVLLLVACVNVAMLIFARSVTRFRELSIRAALGAGRARLVLQMFVESLVLTAAATAIGLPAYGWLLRQLQRIIVEGDQTQPTYWLRFGITPKTALWGALLAVSSAALVGVLPALKVTDRHLGRGIKEARSGHARARFGGVTSILIVADVAIAVTAVGFAVGLWGRVRASGGGQDLDGIVAEEYLAASLTLPGAEAPMGRDDGSDGFVSELAAIQQGWVERLQAEPGVRGVAIATDLPRQGHDGLRVDVEGETALDDLDFLHGLNRWVRFARVDIDFFDALDQRVVAGRGFDRSDLADGANTVIVNTRFVDRFLGGRNPIGRRIRFPDTVDGGEAPWYEIVGVVPRLGMNITMPEYDSGVYFPAAPGTIYPLRFAVHVNGDPQDFSPRLRTLIGEVDPRAVLSPPMVLDRARDGNWILFLMTATSLAVLVAILVVMAASGLYAIMSFAVSERIREIGIRVALGAGRASIAVQVVRRSLAQIALGALLGMPLAGWLFQLIETRLGDTGAGVGIAFGVSFVTGVSLVTLIGALSFVSPLRRALSIEPTEALRADA